MLRLLVIVALTGIWQHSALAQATKPADDAAALYLRAAGLLELEHRPQSVVSPTNSNLNYNNYPPYPPGWYRMEKEDFAANAEIRSLSHQARSIEHANWPPVDLSPGDQNYFNQCRALCNDLSDAAIYQHVQGDDAAAIETLRDLWHLADMLDEGSSHHVMCMLVSEGIRAGCVSRLEIITSQIALTKDPHDTKSLQVDIARDFIVQLLKHGGAKGRVDEALRSEGADANEPPREIDRCIEQVNRINAERDMAAMSLACHLYRFDTGAWPKTLEDLHAYLPSIAIDPWGDGKQTLGYALIKGGLPDGADRPLVYSRAWMKDGLFFRIDEPEYSFYTGDGSDRPWREQKRGGQFRDVASWVPPAGRHPVPATQPLQ
jgi:hypothetical protein